jgi:C-terminal processing protease CtpA/Prc
MRLASAVIAVGLSIMAPAHALTLDCGIEKTDVEGRIGVRISTSGHPGSPAEAAGLRKNDTVVLVDGKKHAIDQISGEPGTTVELVVRRGWHKMQLAVERTDVRTIQYF